MEIDKIRWTGINGAVFFSRPDGDYCLADIDTLESYMDAVVSNPSFHSASKSEKKSHAVQMVNEITSGPFRLVDWSFDESWFVFEKGRGKYVPGVGWVDDVKTVVKKSSLRKDTEHCARCGDEPRLNRVFFAAGNHNNSWTLECIGCGLKSTGPSLPVVVKMWMDLHKTEWTDSCVD